jgi:hypothetical protein
MTGIVRTMGINRKLLLLLFFDAFFLFMVMALYVIEPLEVYRVT